MSTSVFRYAASTSSRLLRIKPTSSQCEASAFASSRRGYSTKVAPAAAGESKATGKKKADRASIIPAGTVMKSLSVLKDRADPVALPDDQYPDWLWSLVEDPSSAKHAEGSKQEGKEKGQFDFRTERKKLRAGNKAEIKARNFLKTT